MIGGVGDIPATNDKVRPRARRPTRGLNSRQMEPMPPNSSTSELCGGPFPAKVRATSPSDSGPICVRPPLCGPERVGLEDLQVYPKLVHVCESGSLVCCTEVLAPFRSLKRVRRGPFRHYFPWRRRSSGARATRGAHEVRTRRGRTPDSRAVCWVSRRWCLWRPVRRTRGPYGGHALLGTSPQRAPEVSRVSSPVPPALIRTLGATVA